MSPWESSRERFRETFGTSRTQTARRCRSRRRRPSCRWRRPSCSPCVHQPPSGTNTIKLFLLLLNCRKIMARFGCIVWDAQWVFKWIYLFLLLRLGHFHLDHANLQIQSYIVPKIMYQNSRIFMAVILLPNWVLSIGPRDQNFKKFFSHLCRKFCLILLHNLRRWMSLTAP